MEYLKAQSAIPEWAMPTLDEKKIDEFRAWANSITTGGRTGQDYIITTPAPLSDRGFNYYFDENWNIRSDGTLELKSQNKPLKEGVEMKNLYEVIGVYGEDRNHPVVIRDSPVIASDEEDAKVKSGIYKWIQESWDADYLTIIARNLGAVKVKEKAKEVKQV